MRQKQSNMTIINIITYNK